MASSGRSRRTGWQPWVPQGGDLLAGNRFPARTDPKVDPDSRQPDPPLRPGPQPACKGQAEGVECWKELASHPGCHVWDNHYYEDQTATWTDGCSDGLAEGSGTLQWVRGDEENESTGVLRIGKREGHWVERYASGTVQEGPYVDGKQHGRWVVRFANGTVSEGPVSHGKPNGRWVIRGADGQVEEGPYIDGKRHGDWVIRRDAGTTATSTYINGELQ